MPDIEKRLEAFVRLAHGIVVFPGGVGTAEEILYLLGILLDPANAEQPLPVVLTGPAEQRGLFRADRPLHRAARWARRRCARFTVIIDDPAAGGAAHGARHATRCASSAAAHSDSYNFNWLLAMPREFQQPFEVTHASRCARSSCTATSRCTSWPPTCGARSPASSPATSRRDGIQAIERHGPYELPAIPTIMRLLDELLAAFVAQRRMKLPGSVYRPCTASSRERTRAAR